jgi:hypothetical protein
MMLNLDISLQMEHCYWAIFLPRDCIWAQIFFLGMLQKRKTRTITRSMKERWSSPS